MPMYQALSLFFLALALASLAAIVVPRLRRSLSQPIVWIGLAAAGSAASLLSAFVASTRHAGTGFTTSHGWPKPFYFLYLDEAGAVREGWSVLYFVGNSLLFAGAALLLWTAWQLSRR